MHDNRSRQMTTDHINLRGKLKVIQWVKTNKVGQMNTVGIKSLQSREPVSTSLENALAD
jgi:hypothetical protein